MTYMLSISLHYHFHHFAEVAQNQCIYIVCHFYAIGCKKLVLFRLIGLGRPTMKIYIAGE